MFFRCARHVAHLELTFLLVYLHLHVKVDTCNDQVRNDVRHADSREDVRVIERNLLGDLHHHKDDHQVGTVHLSSAIISQVEDVAHICGLTILKDFTRAK
jgi:hypothetical protein